MAETSGPEGALPLSCEALSEAEADEEVEEVFFPEALDVGVGRRGVHLHPVDDELDGDGQLKRHARHQQDDEDVVPLRSGVLEAG